MKKALILLGCPESPSQTPMASYATYQIEKLGYQVTVAANPAALKLLQVSDPKECYIKDMVDIERCLESLDEGKYDLFVGFVHKDAAVSYFITFYHIINTKSMALIFHRDADTLMEFEDTVKANTDSLTVSARAHHNPTPIRVKFDRALKKIEESE
jgi:hypothetical protein